MRKIPILFLAHDPYLYGANRSMLNLLAGLKDRIEAHVVVPRDGPLIVELKRIGVMTYLIEFAPWGYFNYCGPKQLHRLYRRALIHSLINRRAMKRILDTFDDFGISIIHSNSSVIGFGNSLARKLRCKHVWHVREYQDLDHKFKSFLPKSMVKKRLRDADAVISISNSVANYFGLRESSQVIYNGVREHSSSIKSEKQDFFLFCGVVKKAKGIEDAIDAMAVYVKAHVAIRLKIAGPIDPNYKSFLESKVGSLGLERHIDFLGFTNEVDALMANARGLLMCSKNEAMGRVTAEAMLLGCPVIGYNCGGTAELIVHNVTGFLYDTIESLARTMEEVTVNSNLVNNVVTEAQKFAEANFLQQAYVEKVFKVYTSLLTKAN